MLATVSGLFAVIFYSLGTLLQGRDLLQARTGTQHDVQRRKVLFFAVLALVIHLINVVQVIATDGGYDFGVFKIATLFSWTIALIVVVSSLRKPLDNLFLALFPLAILSILSSLLLPSSAAPEGEIGGGVALHILLGIAAFSIITIAAVQSVLVAWLNRELKQKHFSPMLQHLPPLQTLEALLFELIWAGFFALLGVIVTGFLFMDDMFAQHLAHKTFFTILSTAVFAILLWGRHQLGWRGRTAYRWTLAGFGVLILAYFGSKFVLELLLDRV
jgi:ABC-type uncharacterized transport system permease subunit